VALDLSKLNPEQKAAVVYRGGPLLILAGAGTGKTRVIVNRIASLIEEGAPAERILAVTFTNKAAEEMRKRVETLLPGQGGRVWVHTFHALAVRILRRNAEVLGLTPHFTVYDQTDQKRIIVEVLKELGLEKEKTKARLYVSVISRAKDDLLDPESYAIHAMAQRDLFRQNVAKVYEVYDKKLRASGGLDFGDLLMKLAQLLKENESVRDYYQKFFQHVLVDEYQDTNYAQYLVTKIFAAQHRNLCVVGDPDQSIYQWRGATIRNILEFESDFKDVKTVKLEQNYRSTPNILNAATAVIRNNSQRQVKGLWTEKSEGEAVSSIELADERDEARTVVNRIVGLLDEGFSLKDIAVFYRTNAQSRQFEEAMSLNQVPYRVVGSVRFYERKEVKDVLSYARAVINATDSVSLSRVINIPTRGIGKTAEAAFRAAALEREIPLRQALTDPEVQAKLSAGARRGCRELGHVMDRLEQDSATLTPTEIMEAVLHRTGYWEMLEAQIETDPDAANRLGNIQELLNAVKEFEEMGTPENPAKLQRFLEDVALQSGADGYSAESQAVTLMTVHLAKGLEFPVVFVTGLEQGLFPIGAADELEEERRLAYVAMTRAEQRLFLTHAATRRMFGKMYSNLPSQFILEARLFGDDQPDENEIVSEPTEQAAPAAPLMRVKEGLRVQHPEFGLGKIVEKSGSGEALKVTIMFDNGKTKKLLARYAPLSPA
jgi:DNA helicase-2/ATP-dependent DNA helicase PcrA